MGRRVTTLAGLLATALLAGSAAALVPTVPAFAAATDSLAPIDLPKLLPSVVSVTVHYPIDPNAPPPAPGQPARKRELGSGFIIDRTGLIVTAQHVVVGGNDFTVTFFDGTQAKADLLFQGETVDVAMLKARSGGPFPTVHLGDSNTVRIGDPVFAIGNPIGLQNTVTHGIISALDRNIGDTEFDNYMQTDAPINPGNSGGPLFNASGEVIGVNIAIQTRGTNTGSIGLAFVMPINEAAWPLRQWHRSGDVRPAWIGADVQALSPDLSAALSYPRQTGAVIAAVDPGGPAAEAKLQTGDVVLKFGDEVQTNPRSVVRAVLTSQPGRAVPMEIWRDNTTTTVQVTPRVWPDHVIRGILPASDQDLPIAVPADLGIAVEPLDEATRGKVKLPADQQGVRVTKVAPLTDAADKGLDTETIILAAQGQPVATPAAFWARVEDARKQKQPWLLLLTRRSNGASLIALRLGS